MASVATKSTSRCTGHDNCPPTGIESTGQSTVVINGSPVVCVGDTFQKHGCGEPYKHPMHTPVVAEGSAIFEINGKAVAYVGCQCSGCPGSNSIASGDPLVQISG